MKLRFDIGNTLPSYRGPNPTAHHRGYLLRSSKKHLKNESWQPNVSSQTNLLGLYSQPETHSLLQVAFRPTQIVQFNLQLRDDDLKSVPVMPSPRMLLPSTFADDQTREPRVTTSQESGNEHVDSAQRPGNHQTCIGTGTHFGDPHYCNHHDRSGGFMTI
jgi:hypothetical protein